MMQEDIVNGREGVQGGHYKMKVWCKRRAL